MNWGAVCGTWPTQNGLDGEVMENAIELRVPNKCDIEGLVGVRPSWGETKEVK